MHFEFENNEQQQQQQQQKVKGTTNTLKSILDPRCCIIQLYLYYINIQQHTMLMLIKFFQQWNINVNRS